MSDEELDREELDRDADEDFIAEGTLVVDFEEEEEDEGEDGAAELGGGTE